MPTLLIMKGAALDQRVPLPGAGGRLVLGRGRSNDVILDDHGLLVSRRHAEVRAGADGYSVVDLGSENGVWRGGTRVVTTTLEAVEPIVIGPYCLLLGETAFDPSMAPAPAYPARDESSGPSSVSSPGSYAAVLIGAGILIGMIGGGLVMWLLLSAGARSSAAPPNDGDARSAIAVVAPAMWLPAIGRPTQASCVCGEEPA